MVEEDPIVTNLLASLFPADADNRAKDTALDRFLSEALGTRLDGVRYWRIVEDAPDRARICGEVWTIEQTTSVFWLDLERRPGRDKTVNWTLFYDIASPKRARNAVHLIESPDLEQWRTRSSGRVPIEREQATERPLSR